MKTLRFVPLAEEHIPAVLEIEKRSNGSPWSDRSFRNELDHKHARFLVAMLEGEIVGYAGMWLVVDEAHITTVAVVPEHRRRGIGRKLMLELLAEAQMMGMVCSTLEVRAGNSAAIAMYVQLGYVATATRSAYYPDNKEDAVVMWMFDLQAWKR